MKKKVREQLREKIKEYAGSVWWEAEGWGENVPTLKDLGKKLTDILDFIEQEIDRAREEIEREKEEVFLSNCCGASIEGLNAEDIGRCSECGEGCAVDKD